MASQSRRGLLAGGGRRELDVLDAERVQRLGDRDLGLWCQKTHLQTARPLPNDEHPRFTRRAI